jgi:hypothetical protein
MSFSLEILRNNPDFAALFAEKAEVIRVDKANLLSAAKEYQSKYAAEINEGTERRKMLLEDGKRKGMKPDEVFKDYTVFIPASNTPILNYLFFMLREHDYSPTDAKVICEQYNREFGHVVEEKDRTAEPLPNMVSFIYCNIGDETFATIKKLKALSKSDNEAEAFSAYRKCMEMCKKYKLEFDRIP